MPIPLFIVGSPRTGTTWLANILCQHSDIAGIQAKKHFGIHESSFFSHIENNYGSLKDNVNYLRFVKIFTATNYFILSGLNKKNFYKQRVYTYHKFFQLLMDEFAKKENVNFWLEKTPAHTLHLNRIAFLFPNAIFIAIKRNIMDTVKSNIKLMQRTKTLYSKKIAILKEVLRYHLFYSEIEYFKSQNNKRIQIVHYEDIKKHPHKVVMNLCKFIGIPFEPQMLNVKYKPNTSFKDHKEREQILSLYEKRFIETLDLSFSIIPHSFFHILSFIWKFLMKRKWKKISIQ